MEAQQHQSAKIHMSSGNGDVDNLLRNSGGSSEPYEKEIHSLRGSILVNEEKKKKAKNVDNNEQTGCCFCFSSLSSKSKKQKKEKKKKKKEGDKKLQEMDFSMLTGMN
jgi:hypothetical protein